MLEQNNTTTIENTNTVDVSKDFGNNPFYSKNYDKQISKLTLNSTQNVLTLGKIFNESQEVAKKHQSMKLWLQMLSDLKFNRDIADKYIKVYEDENIKEYVEYCPSSYTTLYEELRGLDVDTWESLLGEGLNYNSTQAEIKTMKSNIERENAEAKMTKAEKDRIANQNAKKDMSAEDVYADKIYWEELRDDYKGDVTFNRITEVISSINFKSISITNENAYFVNQVMTDALTKINKKLDEKSVAFNIVPVHSSFKDLELDEDKVNVNGYRNQS